MINWTQPHLIMEYAVIDSIGRNKGWHLHGVVDSIETAHNIVDGIRAKNPKKTVQMKLYEYTQAFGSQQIA